MEPITMVGAFETFPLNVHPLASNWYMASTIGRSPE